MAHIIADVFACCWLDDTQKNGDCVLSHGFRGIITMVWADLVTLL